MNEEKLCCVCKKKKIKFITTALGSLNYGFCSKVCLANHAIDYFKLEKVDEHDEM